MAETKSVAGTQTEKNLATSYLNESQSYARYTFYAQKAVKESYFPIGMHLTKQPRTNSVMPRSF